MTPEAALDRITGHMATTTAMQLLRNRDVHAVARAEFTVTLRLVLDHPEYARVLYAAVTEEERASDALVVAALVETTPIAVEVAP